MKDVTMKEVTIEDLNAQVEVLKRLAKELKEIWKGMKKDHSRVKRGKK